MPRSTIEIRDGVKTKFCAGCDTRKPVHEYSDDVTRSNGINGYCKECMKHKKRESKYNLTKNQYEMLLESQNGVCRICKQMPNNVGNNGKLHVDHDYKTGKVRGLLCFKCNHGIGNFNDSVELLIHAAEYLVNYGGA